MRKILYVSGTRADFGLMQSTLKLLNDDQDFDLGIVVTGMHLSPRHGETVKEIEAAGLNVVQRIQTDLDPATGATMARDIGTMVTGFTDIFVLQRPDIVLLLGDRGEMLAAAIAAIHLNIAIAHIHGGERSGTVDEPMRHAISKLSHIHLVATQESQERLIGMGEKPATIFVTGAPGLDGLEKQAANSFEDLFQRLGLAPEISTCLFLFHPVVQEAKDAGTQASVILNAALEEQLQIVALLPNSDAGSDEIRKTIYQIKNPLLHRFDHLSRHDFISLMKFVDVMIGNSSAGIIEAASFGTPVLNFGTRQAFRERNKNVTDLGFEPDKISKALKATREMGQLPTSNVYGDGKAGERICAALKSIDFGPGLLNKVMEY